MDNTFLTQITNGRVEAVETGRNGSFVLVSSRDCPNCGRDQTIRLNVVSTTGVRSTPPQAAAYVIQVVGRPRGDNVTVGRIVDVDRQNRSFTTVSDGNISSIMRFNVADNAQIFNVMGRPMNFAGLVPGLRVRVRHAAFMTMSIPPQTTAFEVRVVR